MGRLAEESRVRIPAGKEIFLYLKASVQTGSEVHPAIYPMCISGATLAIK
jgi:hypothetical protein